MIRTPKTFAFVDAANLFYGGEKSLGWRIDYQKLIEYLKSRYNATKVLYFGGVEIYKFKYDYLAKETVPINDLIEYLDDYVQQNKERLTEARLALIDRHLRRVLFYKKLASFGYDLYLKPVKTYDQDTDSPKRKANCDVEMAYYLMRDIDHFDRAVILSGDGDFLPILKHLKEKGKDVIVLARSPRTAKEIKRFAGGNFRDFEYLKYLLKMDELPIEQEQEEGR